MEETRTEIDRIREEMPEEEIICDLAELFKVFGDTTRTKIMSALEIKDMCVGDLAEVLEMTISAISHQLRILRSAKLVKATKQGKEVVYSLDDDHVSKIIECGLNHINE